MPLQFVVQLIVTHNILRYRTYLISESIVIAVIFSTHRCIDRECIYDTSFRLESIHVKDS